MTSSPPARPSATPSRALVLGGGGIAGIAWESGLLLGLRRAGVRLSDADLVVGTSAGSVVATLLRSGRLTLRSLVRADWERRRSAPAASASPEALNFDAVAFDAMRNAASAGGGDDRAARARIGAVAAAAPVSLAEERWVDNLGQSLPADWPPGRLAITAVDAGDGSFTVFDSDAGVPLARAVAASCTVPQVFPLVTIGDSRFMDGGMRSATNADVAAGHDRVVVVSCGPELPKSPFGPTLDQAVARLRTEGDVLVVGADGASLAAFGTNVLDPAVQRRAAVAGFRQGLRQARTVRDFWASRPR